MAEFAKLQPAFRLRMQTSSQLIIGQTSPATGLAVGPIEHGTLTSVEGYGTEKFEGKVVNGADIFCKTPSGVKLDFRSVIQPTEGEMLYFTFSGFIEANEDTAAVMSGDPNATGTNWGSSSLTGSFETGNPKWKHLTNKYFVGSQRLLRQPGKHLEVEINLSQVVVN
ncbi:hypothetical protein BGZ63DRAFT_454951 [Mariannaea sp. PMI_226]|nr:hypothetical protein BGZ63DRAFT_454951 [Mariannaea sp. PMI_226]